MRRRHELTDVQWAKVEGLLFGKAGDPGRTAADNRLFANAVLYVLKTGVPWADLPDRFGKHNTIWKRYDRPAAAGVWERVGRTLGDGDLAGEGVEEAQLTNTSVKDHSVASTGRRLTSESKKRQATGAASAGRAAG